ncbi:3-phosphoshikimate 1-carboxyvinyltransferase [bacterium A37T11]|nr:3-phosphoshikimate 1-carboxyvinyltransferase [bacterium A37T11]
METERQIRISRSFGPLSGSVQLTGSKSESNRALVMAALSGGQVSIENLGNAADTIVMQQALTATLQQGPGPFIIDIGPAGTAMRFLSAYLPFVPGKEFILTGTARMRQRPIRILTEALQELGAHIQYTHQEGYPPLQIKGGFRQLTKSILIEGNVSSQYLSALLLIAAFLPEGLTLQIFNELTSKPYIEMTLRMLAQAGISYQWQDNSISIPHQTIAPCTIQIEPDWSAASYWYAMLVLSAPGSQLFLPGLQQNSLQGDKAIAEIMSHFGISTSFVADGVRLSNNGQQSDKKLFDFKSCPDLAQTVIVCCAALGRDATFTGLETLKIKETDRIKALQTEMAKFGVKFFEEKHQVYRLDCSQRYAPASLLIHTYEDHRMAMAFAPLALVFPEIQIADPEVVNKSYPDFWRDLENKGFKTNAILA